MDLGLLQADVAAKIGVCEASVWNWETGRNEPELRFIPAIISFLGRDPRLVPTSLAGRLIRYREAQGWSQKRLARELAVDQSTLSRWEQGKREPVGPFLERVHTLLGT